MGRNIKKRFPAPYRLIMCEGIKDKPYMQALCLVLFSFPQSSWSLKPNIDHAYGGAQWKIVTTASQKLQSINDKRSRALVIIDSDRGIENKNERIKAETLANRFPAKYGRIELLYLAPCLEGFVLSLNGKCAFENATSLQCKQGLAELCEQLRIQPGLPSSMVRLFPFTALNFVPHHPNMFRILQWLNAVSQ